MKTAPTKIAMIAFAGALLVGQTAMASYNDVKEGYVSGAFADVDDDWMRMTTNRYGDCGEYGSKGYTRVGVLVARYNALGAALDAGDDAAAREAAAKLNTTIEASPRFEGCWDAVSRKAGISRSLKRSLASL